MSDDHSGRFSDIDIETVGRRLEREDYITTEEIRTAVYLSLRLGKPLLIEGDPGSGKTTLAGALASGFETDLIRLQCYEGLTAEKTLYEWNYTKQLLAIQSGEGGVEGESSVFDEEYLLDRPLLAALRHDGDRPPVLLIDEIDRADEEFEALLLEVLDEFQVSIPELGTVRATVPPIVVITSNRTRGLSDALKRRCLYLHLDPPSIETEREILQRKVPELDGAIAAQLCAVVARLREEPLLKRPGVAETLDWARAVESIDREGSIRPETIEATIGCLLKESEDIDRLDEELLADLGRVAASAD